MSNLVDPSCPPTASASSGLAALLSRPWFPVFPAALGMLLSVGSLNAGWLVDDLWHRSFFLQPKELADAGVLKSDVLMDFFSFMDGDPERNHKLMDIGLLPWWSDENLSGAFFRPVTAATHWLDYQLWPGAPALHHLHSIVWFGLLTLAVGCLYRRVMGSAWMAGVAAILYAVDDAHGMPIGFLANRNTLVAGFFGVLTLLLHDRWRRTGWRMGAVLAVIVFAVALLSAEAAIATVAYVFAYTVYLDRAAGRRRWWVLIPYALIVIAWRIVWSRLGYGLSPGMEAYIDPVVEPLHFVTSAVYRIPVLLFGHWVASADLAFLATAVGPVAVVGFWLIAVLFVGSIVFVLRPIFRRDVIARFWALGMVLSLIPICAAFPSDRLLTFAGIGGMGLIARLLNPHVRRMMQRLSAWRQAHGRPSGFWLRGFRLMTVVFVLIHLIIAPMALAFRAANPIGPSSFMRPFFVNNEFDDAVRRQQLIIVNAPVVMFAGMTMMERALDSRPVPRHLRCLSASGVDTRLHRVDARTLTVRPDGGYLAWPFDTLFRGKHQPLALNQRVQLTGVTLIVTELTTDGRPAEVTCRFDVRLEDRSMRWLRWGGHREGFVAFEPPGVGETLLVESPGI